MNNTKKLTIAVDMDGVLVNLVKTWCERLNALYNMDFAPSDFTGMVEDTAKKFGLTEEQIFVPFHEEGFWENLAPQDDVLEHFPKIIEKFDVVIVTAPSWKSARCAYEKKKWLIKHFGIMDVIMTGHKERVKADVIIDDLERNFLTCQDHMTTVCYSQPWNKDVKTDYRINSWSEAMNVLEQIELAKNS